MGYDLKIAAPGEEFHGGNCRLAGEVNGEGALLIADVEQDENGFGGVTDSVSVGTSGHINMDCFSLPLPDDGMVAAQMEQFAEIVTQIGILFVVPQHGLTAFFHALAVWGVDAAFLMDTDFGSVVDDGRAGKRKLAEGS